MAWSTRGRQRPKVAFMRLGNMYGPDATFVGVPAADLADPSSYAGAAAVIIGAPFDGGTSHRPGCRFGPQAIRSTDYLPHDGSRPHLALDVDPLRELNVVDVGDVKMLPGETDRALERLEAERTAAEKRVSEAKAALQRAEAERAAIDKRLAEARAAREKAEGELKKEKAASSEK